MPKCCEVNFTIEESKVSFNLEDESLSFDLDSQYGGSGGTSNYNSLTNKPKINGVTVIGDKTSSDYFLQDLMNDITEQEIDNILFGG